MLLLPVKIGQREVTLKQLHNTYTRNIGNIYLNKINDTYTWFLRHYQSKWGLVKSYQ